MATMPDDEKARLAEALEERAALWEEAHRARALERDLEHARRLIAGLQDSVSWKLTAPLRAAKIVVEPRARLAAELARRGRSRLRQSR